MKFREDFLRRYLEMAPAALAVERTLECEILIEQSFEHPILDIGCGDGIFASILFDGRIDTGIDPDSSEIARASRMGAYEELIVCPGSVIPKADQSFNTILSNSVLEHIPDLTPVLKEAHRLLTPSGLLFVTIPTDRLEHNSAPARLFRGLRLRGLETWYGGFHNRFWQHYNVYSCEEWRALFADAGFEVIEERLYASPNFSSFYDLLMPFAIPSILAKRFFGRWLLFPWLRKFYVGLVTRIVGAIHARLKLGAGSSLVFFALKRSS